MFEIYGYNNETFEKKVSHVPGFRIGDLGFVSDNVFEGGIFRPTNQTHTCSTRALKLKRYTHYEEEQTMSTKVGSFTNPTTGETDWLEPNTISIIVLDSKMVVRVNETAKTPIDFKLNTTPDEKHITLTAEYTANNKKYSSNPVLIDVEKFASEFAVVVYQDTALDETDMIKDAKEEASRDLTKRLMDNNILMGGMQFAGIGFVYVDKEKVMTLEGIDFDYKVENGTPVRTAQIRNCVSQASLANLDNPRIVLYTGTHSVELLSPVVNMEKSSEGRIKTYLLNISDIVVKVDSENPEHTEFKELNFNNEDFVDLFVSDRKGLLDDITGNDSSFDDQFADLF